MVNFNTAVNDTIAFGNQIQKTAANTIKKFNIIPPNGQARIATKTAFVAAGAGLLTACTVGTLPATVVTVGAGIAAFYQFTSAYSLKDGIKDFANGMLAGVKDAIGKRD